MFFAQLFKFLFVAFFIYMVFNLIMMIMRLGRSVAGKKPEPEKARPQRPAEASFGTRGGRQVIELDKDQYKVE